MEVAEAMKIVREALICYVEDCISSEVGMQKELEESWEVIIHNVTHEIKP
jgi:hypothetical protein